MRTSGGKADNRIRWRVALLLCAALLTVCLVRPSAAVAAETDTGEAVDLTGETEISFSGNHRLSDITDNKNSTWLTFDSGETVTITAEQDFYSLYILWNKIPGPWTYTAGGASGTGGADGYQHEYIALEAPTREITVTIPEGGAEITDLHVFSEGTLPDWVQVWQPPHETADIMLFSTHADDEQLFFAGILPYYAVERQVAVQVVYMTNHWAEPARPHELLNGLWTVGIRNYPIISEFADDYRAPGKTGESVESVLERARNIYDEEEWVCFEVEMLRRFKPQVVIDHDLRGEYVHGAHILNSVAMQSAVELSADPNYDPETAEKYGLWDVPKTYFHLYGENQIVMDWDTPYESLGGLTPFEMTKKGFACHESQQRWWFSDWINKDKAESIGNYSPCKFGLYRSTVGEDVKKNDFLEHIIPYSMKEEAERLAREEEERLAQEEERLAQLEEELRRQQEQQSKGQDDEPAGTPMEQTQPGMHAHAMVLIGLCVLLVVLISITIIGVARGKQ